jgi:hypothetical protein
MTPGRKIHLGMDIYSSPLWSPGADGLLGTIPIEDINVSKDLGAALDDWAENYNSIFETNDERFPNSGVVAEEFDRAGIQLWERLVEELGQSHEVHYDSPLTGQSTLIHRPDQPVRLDDGKS